MRENPEVPIFRVRFLDSCNELARRLVREGRRSEAAEWFGQAAQVLEDRPRKTGNDLYELACVQARAAAALSERQGGLTADGSPERDRFIAAAIDALRRSIEMGSRTLSFMQADTDLEILRGRADFQALLARKKTQEEAATKAQREESGTPEEKLKAHERVLAGRAKKAGDASTRPRPPRRPGRQPARCRPGAHRPRPPRRGREDLEGSARRPCRAGPGRARELPLWTRRGLDAPGSGGDPLQSSPSRSGRSRVDGRARRHGRRHSRSARRQPASDRGRQGADRGRHKLLQLGLWEDAVQPLDYVFQRKPASLATGTGRPWQYHGLLHLLTGDQAGFRASCAEFFKQFRNEDNKSSLYQVCIAGADALPALDLQRLAEMAEKDLRATPRTTRTSSLPR